MEFLSLIKALSSLLTADNLSTVENVIENLIVLAETITEHKSAPLLTDESK